MGAMCEGREDPHTQQYPRQREKEHIGMLSLEAVREPSVWRNTHLEMLVEAEAEAEAESGVEWLADWIGTSLSPTQTCGALEDRGCSAVVQTGWERANDRSQRSTIEGRRVLCIRCNILKCL